jgi:uncharacterized FlaG/YvyC family protein
MTEEEKNYSDPDYEAYARMEQCLGDPDFCKENGLDTWAAIVKYVGKSDPTCRKYRDKINAEKLKNEDGTFNLSQYLASEQEKIARSLVKKATSGNVSVQAIKLVLEQLKELVDASGKTVEFSIDDKYRIALGVVADLRRAYQDSGDCPVCGRYELLRSDLCVDTRREQQEESPVAAVEIPDGPDPDTEALSRD